MFVVVVTLAHQQNLMQFVLDDRTRAQVMVSRVTAAMEMPKTRTLSIADDYGHEAVVRIQDVVAVYLEDAKKAGDAALERSLIQMRSQAKCQREAANDPTLKLMAGQQMGGGGPFRMS